MTVSLSCEIIEQIQQICPTGKSLLIFRNRVKPLSQKYFASRLTKSDAYPPTSCSDKRGVAHVTKRGAGCGGRGGVRRANSEPDE
jgi:hypothetical protein